MKTVGIEELAGQPSVNMQLILMNKEIGITGL
jgi:hypothetical protein